MLRINMLMIAAALTASVVAVATAQDVFVYPNKGQSAKQQEKDKYDCYQWAKGQTGFDPSQPTQVASAPPPQSGKAPGGVGRGALRGAVGGAVIGEIADDDAGKGAAIGAVAGGLFGGMRRRGYEQKQTQAHQQQQQQQVADYNARRASYNRAYAACLEGRGYTVK